MSKTLTAHSVPALASNRTGTGEPVAFGGAASVILTVGVPEDEEIALRRLLADMCGQIVSAGTCRSALQHLRESPIAIVLCEKTLPDGTWRDVLSYIEQCSEKPLLIVTGACADEQLWAEVLNLGGFDVIAKPFSGRDLRHTLQTACLTHEAPIPR